eukprot:1162006-Pelagomonas_calceolata.AAC.3
MHQQPPSSPSSSAVQPSLLMRALPPQAHPYAQLMRLDKPIGTWLLLWPCLWWVALLAVTLLLLVTLIVAAGCWLLAFGGKEREEKSSPANKAFGNPAPAVGLLVVSGLACGDFATGHWLWAPSLWWVALLSVTLLLATGCGYFACGEWPCFVVTLVAMTLLVVGSLACSE